MTNANIVYLDSFALNYTQIIYSLQFWYIEMLSNITD